MKHQAADVRAESMARLWCRSGQAREIRKAARATVRGTAQLAGTTSPNISRWENGTRVPTGPNAVRYYKALLQLQAITAAAHEAVGA